MDCPGCGGPMHKIEGTNRLRCDNCGWVYYPPVSDAEIAHRLHKRLDKKHDAPNWDDHTERILRAY